MKYVGLENYAKNHTVKECAIHYKVAYDNIQAYIARHHIKHSSRKSFGKYNNNYRNGMSASSLDFVYYAMLRRCYNPKCKAYSRYGARGIEVCEDWKKDKQSFFAWAIAKGYAKGLTLDRIDNNGNYCPENCAWVTNKENCNHTSRTHMLTYQGKTQSMMKWAEELGINYSTLRNRINRSKMPLDKALRSE